MAIKVCLSTHYGIRTECVQFLGDLQRQGIEYELQVCRSRDMAEAKNILISPQDQKNRYVTIPEQYSHYLFLDQDVIPSIKTFQDMMDANLPVVALAHLTVDGQHHICGKWDKDPGVCGPYLAASVPEGLYEMDWCAFNMALVRREVLAKVERPWFHSHLLFKIEDEKEIVIEMPADLGFCYSLQQHGYKVNVLVSEATKFMWGEYGISKMAKKVVMDIPIGAESGIAGMKPGLGYRP